MRPYPTCGTGSPVVYDGEDVTKDLAESYGTYLALFESEDDEVSISSTTYDGGIERLQSCLQDAILEYQDQNESREPSTV